MKAFTLGLVVFVCGAGVMIMELLGSRVLAPYMGTSTIVWTSLIGVILGRLSAGYWWGGKWADANPSRKILSSIIFISACLMIVISLAADFVLYVIASQIKDLRLSTVAAGCVLFVIPSILLGMVSPFAVRIQMSSVDSSGKLVGRLYALSTVGSIVGTFLTGFWLIPNFGLKQNFILLSVLLVGASVLTYSSRNAVQKTAVVTVLIGMSLLFDSSRYLYGDNLTADINTTYSRVWVSDFPVQGADTKLRILQIDNKNSSAIFLDRHRFANTYISFYRLSEHFKPGKKDTLMIGGGAYVYPIDFIERNPESTMDVLEIDPKITRIAEEYFGLKPNPRMRIIDQDGRIFLNHNSKKYDIVFIDAFKSIYSIPHHLTTLESIQKTYDSLKDDGIVMANVIGVLGGEDSGLFRSVYKTFSEVFPQLRIFLINSPDKPEELQNILIVAFKTEERPKLYSTKSEMNDYLRNLWFEEIPTEDVKILTDNHAPVEALTMRLMERSQLETYQRLRRLKKEGVSDAL